MHYIFYALGTFGDINPMAGLAAELMRRDHQVSFLSNEFFRETIETTGSTFIPVGTLEQYQRGNSEKAWEAGNFEDNFEYYHAPAFEPSYQYVADHASNANTMAIILGSNSGAEVAADKFDMRYVKIILSPNLLFSPTSPPAPLRWAIPASTPKWLLRLLLKRNRKVKFKRFMKASFTKNYRATRTRLDCPVKFQASSNAIAQLGLFPKWYAMPPNDWPTNLQLLNFPMIDQVQVSSRNTFDAICQSLGAPIVFTAGSGRASAKQIFIEGRKLCEQLNKPGVFVGGMDSAKWLDGSTHCAHIDYVDFEYALPKALMIVHHGGVGTVAQAARAGIAQLICPVKYDQPDNADRIHRLGLGTYVMPEYFKVEKILPVVQRMIEQSSNSPAVKHYANQLKGISTISHACNILEQWE